MKYYPIGHKFKVPTLRQLLDTGWVEDIGRAIYSNPQFGVFGIDYNMITDNQGKTFTIKGEWISGYGWYYVVEIACVWPVEAFEIACGVVTDSLEGVLNHDAAHVCQEGCTPIDGFVICKLCGQNLRKFSIYREVP